MPEPLRVKLWVVFTLRRLAYQMTVWQPQLVAALGGLHARANRSGWVDGLAPRKSNQGMISMKGILTITGGTGSFGNAVLKRFLDSEIDEIRIFSRDEKKQDDMRKRYANSKLKFYIGDVRDRRSVDAVMRGVDYVYHAAALKQVPSCEFHPMEAVRTNVLGTENVLNAAVDAGVKRVVCLSTDKAVYPINAMGISKALMEKVMVAASRNLEGTNTVICGTRYGNVMASRGSVIPLFVDQVLAGNPITVTDPTMTRFMMTLADAVDLVLYAFEHGNNGDIFVQKAPAATVDVLTKAILDLMGKPDHVVNVIGTRHGEKLYEALLSREEMACAEDMGDYFRVPPDGRDLNYAKFVDQGEQRLTQSAHGEDYNSHNTARLDVEGMKTLLLKLDFMQRIARGEHAVAEE
jgi:UDP-N-acetylglucosamine 4,6-dehydratase